VVDVLDPTAPVEVGSYVTPGSPRGMAVAGGYLYEADAQWGLMIFAKTASGTAMGQVRVRGTTTNIAGATVEAYRGGVLTKDATANASGIYAMAVPAGRYTLVARKPGYISQTKAGTIVPATETAYVNFGLDPSGAVSGQVKARATGAVLPGTTISIYSGGVLRLTVTTNTGGIYLANWDLPSGVYVLAASKPGFLTQTKANVALTAGETTYVNFSLDRLCIKGQVRAAASSTPIGGAVVRAYQSDVVKATATANASGIYELGGLALGTYTVVASGTGHVRQSKANIAVLRGEVTYVNFSLAVSGKLKGQVKDKGTSDPIVGATVVARSGGVTWATTTTTGPWGIYEIDSDLPAGTFVVGASTTGYLGQTRKDIAVSAGATTYVNFFLSYSAK